MRPALAALVGLALLWPGVAAAGKNTLECRRITNQIGRYEGVVKMAQERDNQLWEDATRDHIGRLEERRAKLCPQFKAELDARKQAAQAQRDTEELMKAAAKIAARYFTFGAF